MRSEYLASIIYMAVCPPPVVMILNVVKCVLMVGFVDYLGFAGGY